MVTPRLSVLVTGATGKQGGAVVRSLLSRGHRVLALTRNPDSPEASKIRRWGAEIVRGSMEDRASMATAMKGADAVFLVTTPLHAGADSELWQGISVTDAARAVGARHLVYSSIPQARTRTGVTVFDSKASIEAYIQSAAVPYTILAPSFFMENLCGPYHLPGLHEGRFTMPLSPGCKLQMVPISNLASFVTLVLEAGQRFHGQRIELASDEHTPAEIAEVLSRAICRNVRHYRTPKHELLAWSKELASVYEWLERVGTSIDIPSLLHEYSQVSWQSLQTWAEMQPWGFLTRVVEELV
ncbi:MAG TPA: NmrA/HSCARG family protein [Terriglobales bacterium]|nr:NmrA/HSCARG family protein [Terriglobales bacterium]